MLGNGKNKSCDKGPKRRVIKRKKKKKIIKMPLKPIEKTIQHAPALPMVSKTIINVFIMIRVINYLL